MLTGIAVAGCSAGGGQAAANDASSIATPNDASSEVGTADLIDAGKAATSDSATGASGGDAGRVPFTDPNPLPCAGMDASALCLMGWPATFSTYVGCCRMDLPQEPQGKCGVSSPGSTACVERKAPGNADPICQGGDFVVQVGANAAGGTGPGCCQWRNGTCGVAADDLGCVDVAQTIFQGMPCTPDYSNGSQYP
jgi:hypothetical protein